jgi:hypothetical protein
LDNHKRVVSGRMILLFQKFFDLVSGELDDYTGRIDCEQVIGVIEHHLQHRASRHADERAVRLPLGFHSNVRAPNALGIYVELDDWERLYFVLADSLLVHRTANGTRMPPSHVFPFDLATG